MRNLAISTIIFLTIVSGCGGADKNLSDDYITVNVSKDYPEKKLILQDVMDVEYIALETTDEFITHGIVADIGEEIILVKNSINDGNIFIFDRRTGKAIRRINRLGQSGEEYPYIAKCTLDEEFNELFITHANKISVYDLYGNFKRSFNFIDPESDYLNVFNYDQNNLIVYNNKGNGMIPDQQPYHAIISKQDGSITREISIPSQGYRTVVIFGENEAKAIPVFFPTTPSLDKWILMNISSDTIYTYSENDDIKPFIVRTPSIYSMDTEIFLFVSKVTDRYYFMRTMPKEINTETMKLVSGNNLVYDKQEKSIFKYKIHNADFLSERPIYWFPTVNQNIPCWNPFDAFELIEAYNNGNLKGRLEKIAAELNEESNPVIMIIKYKK